MEKENRPYYKKLAILSWGYAPQPPRVKKKQETIKILKKKKFLGGISSTDV